MPSDVAFIVQHHSRASVILRPSERQALMTARPQQRSRSTILFLLLCAAPISAFRQFSLWKNGASSLCAQSPTASAQDSSLRQRPRRAQLDQNNVWLLSLNLQRKGYDSIGAELRVRFVESPGYEPPQGRIFIERDSLGLIKTDEKGWAVRPSSWSLSEDKSNRKWGLWIQGLFDEPLFPYLYVTFVVEKEIMARNADGEKITIPLWDNGVPDDKLELRFNHARKGGSSELSQGKVTYKEVEMQKVDALGLGGLANVGEVREAGLAQLRPHVR